MDSDDLSADQRLYATGESRQLLSPAEIAQLCNTDQPGEALAEIVDLVARRLQADACSIYLLEADRSHLVLGATVGLRADCIGTLRMRVTEGLVGLVAESVRPQLIDEALTHPRVKYFPEAGDDAYRTFLGVPLIERGLMQGVFAAQSILAGALSSADLRQLLGLATQIAPIVSALRAIMMFSAPIHERLWSVAHNLWWSWDNDSTSIFRELDPVLWRAVDNNPLSLLVQISAADLQRRAFDLELHARIGFAYRRLQKYLHADRTWGVMHAGPLRKRPVAYFSAEFGLHESLFLYSHGLGVLAGDHLKSASDLDIPLVGIGLFYSQGYFRQRISADGWQAEDYIDSDERMLPMTPAIGADGSPVEVRIDTRVGSIYARVWLIKVGRCDLFLLDSNVDDNQPWDRESTSRLYGGDARVRLRQELLLGVGGVRALKALGLSPGVLHLNDGHGSLAILEATRARMHEEGIEFAEAASQVAKEVVFTTHAPLHGGDERFTAELLEEHLGPLRDDLGLSEASLVGLGRERQDDPDEPFSMTVLGLKLSHRAYAVSALHGDQSRSRWRELYEAKPRHALPIGHITAGIHVPSWLAPQMARLYESYLGPLWHERGADSIVWEGIDTIDDGDLWEMHLHLKARLLEFVHRRLSMQATRRGTPDSVARLERILSPDVLTIGFAHSMSVMKRPGLILTDIEKLTAIVHDPKRPVQFIVAGKSHPTDVAGKQLLHNICDVAARGPLSDRIVFIEDYDINVGRQLVQGVDVWLNMARRPHAGSSFSGQKAVLNGGLNLSVLDGWWAEAFDGFNGFAIGGHRSHSNVDVQDSRDSEDLYQVLVNDVVSLYYDSDRDGLPREWIRRMKRSIRTLGWRVSAYREMMDYTRDCYIPAVTRSWAVAEAAANANAPSAEGRRVMAFLCHASSDKPSVRKLYRRLREDSIVPWLDEQDLLPGQHWALEISKAISRTDVVLVCLSKDSITRFGHVQKEIKHALDLADDRPDGTIFIIPVRLEACEVPDRLAGLHYVDLFREDGYRNLLRALLAYRRPNEGPR